MTTAPDYGASAGHELFGHGFTNNVLPAEPLVMMGIGLTANASRGVVMGYSSRKDYTNCVSMGLQTSAGSAGSGEKCVAIGAFCSAGSGVGNGTSVAMGSSCTADGNQNVAVGRLVSVTAAGAGAVFSCAFGAELTTGKKHVVMIGRTLTVGADNVLAVGDFDGLPSINVPDSIQIGRPDQKSVRIGPYWFGVGTGKTVNVNDAPAAPAADTGIVLYSTITAARVVTMPLAADVPAGASIKVLDVSGNASAVLTITAAPSGADTIVGAGINPIVSAYGKMELVSDGVSKWVKV